jgi:hypothetical protein
MVHEIVNDNLRDSGYWQYPSLPPYWILYNDGTNTIYEIGYGDELNGIGFRYVYDGTEAGAKAIAICETVKSEGGVALADLPGFPFTVYNLPTAPVAVTSTTDYKPILSIRPAATFNSLANGAVYIPQLFELSTDNPVFYKIVYRPTLTGASWAAVDAIPYTGLELDVAATALSGGYEIKAGALTSGRNSQVTLGGILGRVILALGYSGTSDILTIAAVKTTSTNAACINDFEGKIIR